MTTTRIDTLAYKPMQAAEALNIGRTAIYALIARNELPGVIRIGRSVRISKRALEAWIEAQAQASQVS